MRPTDMTCAELEVVIARFTRSMHNAAQQRIADGRKTKAEADATLRRILDRTDKARTQLRMCCSDGGRIRGWIEDTETDSISFQSSRTTDWWTVNDNMCECPAYEAGNYCWHRPADRLIRMWWRLREQSQPNIDTDFEQVPPPRTPQVKPTPPVVDHKDVDQFYE